MSMFCGKAPLWLSEAFSDRNLKLIEVGCSTSLQKPVASHIDLMAVKVSDKLFVAKEFLLLSEYEDECIEIKQELCGIYPKDVPLNVASVGKYLICNPKTAASEIIIYADESGIELIPTVQGYTKCSTLIIDDNSIITEDDSIYNAAKDKLSVLKIEKGYVELPGYDYGFIGGASFSDNEYVYFFGDIKAHPQFEEIEKFVHLRGKEIIVLGKEHKLFDIGGVIVL